MPRSTSADDVPRRTARVRLSSSALRAWRHAGPERTAVVTVAKSALAATAAWAVSHTLLQATSPAFAPFAAVVMVHVTVRESLARSLRFVGAAVLGVCLQGLLGFVFEPRLWTFAVVATVALVIGRWSRLGAQGQLVTTAAFFAYSVFISDDGAADRMGMLAQLVGLVLVGCAIGLVVNILVLPPLRYRRAEYGVTNLARSSGDLVGEVAGIIQQRPPAEDEADEWWQRARRLEGMGARVREALDEGRRSLRWNPRRLLMRTRPSLDGYFELADRLAATGERIRSIATVLRRISRDGDDAEPAFLRRYGQFLAQLHRSLDRLADIDPDHLDRALSALEQESSRAREVLEELVASDAAGEVDLFDDRIRGGLLLEAQRLMAEIQGADEALVPTEQPSRAEHG
ncbi:FUSC family protein [Streptomonospora halophila]|uniref:FUSC family protein n=1 Tax=Streptomonospora halophila TaxID=427369 RepID=UPI0031E508A4